MSAPAPKVDPVVAELQREAAAFKAEEAQAAPPPAEPAAAAPPGADTEATAKLLVTLLDFAATSFLGQHLKLSPGEQQLIATQAQPVIALYLPPDLFLGPVGALVVTVGAIYAGKLMAAPPPAAQTVDGTATSATAPGPTGAEQAAQAAAQVRA